MARWLRAERTPLVAATDASWKDHRAGYGYVRSDGHFGLRGRGTDWTDPTGPSHVLVNELRAVELLLPGPGAPEPMILLLDSVPAIGYLRRWQAGETTAMPAGYDLRPRRRSEQPTLVRLAHRVANSPELTFRHALSPVHLDHAQQSG